jgi:glutathione S-transferase
MTQLTLYVAPGSCARVPTIVLEELGVEFDTVLVRFMQGEQKSAHFKRINPKGKVPALVIDGQALTENVAIISFLNDMYPARGLIPAAGDALERARHLADLCFCSTTLHPLMTRMRMPQLFAAPGTERSVWEKGCAAIREYFELIDARLAGAGPWWYGEQWSALDAYIYWVFWRAEGAAFPVAEYPHYAAHGARMAQRPAVQRTVAREAQWQAQLASEGLVFSPPAMPPSAATRSA